MRSGCIGIASRNSYSDVNPLGSGLTQEVPAVTPLQLSRFLQSANFISMDAPGQM